MKAIITNIHASSRASVKVGDSFYTVEYSEDRAVPDVENIDVEQERQELWDTVNTEVDNQIADILKTFKK